MPGLGRVDPTLTADVFDAPGGSVVGALDPSTLVDVSEGPLTGPDGRAYLGVGSPTEGYVPVDQLDPEDSTGPRAWEIEPDPLAFSPDGDGSVDALGVDVTWSEDADWTAKVEEPDGTDLDTWTGDGDTAAFSWDGLGSGGAALPDGSYKLTVRATDTLGNAGASTTRTVTIDTHPPNLDLTGAAADASSPEVARTFTPNGDGQADTLGFGYDVSQAGKIELHRARRRRRRRAPRLDRGHLWHRQRGMGWSGGRRLVGPRWPLRGQPPSQGSGRQQERRGHVVRARPEGAQGRLAIADAHLLRRRRRPRQVDHISFTLTKAATVDWTILRPDGAVLLTKMAGTSATAGAYSWTWSGKDCWWSLRPRGYVSDPDLRHDRRRHRQPEALDLRRCLQDHTIHLDLDRGKKVTVTVVTSEALSYNPRLVVYPARALVVQAGHDQGRQLELLGDLHRQVGGGAGTVKLKAYARDRGDRLQRSYITAPLE